MTDKQWTAWGICTNPECPELYVGDMTWRDDDEGNDYAVCPICDVEIAFKGMPASREARQLDLGF